MGRVRIQVGGGPVHLSQIVAGFAMLRSAGEVQVEVAPAPRAASYRGDAFLRAECDDGRRLVFELRDGTDTNAEELAWCTSYLKRSYHPEVHGADDRIVPLGLNYVTSAAGDWRWRRLLYSLRPTPGASWRAEAGRVWGAAQVPPRVDSFEAPPPRSSKPTALLMARLWDPRRALDGPKAERWEAMNEVRVSYIRALAAELGDRFFGGVSPSPWSIERYPDLVLDAALCERGPYLERMRAADVCVTTAGLSESNGWRLVEYLAASRAIVTEPLRHAVPGPLADGHGLVEAATADECVAAVVALLEDEDRRLELGEAGFAYYREFVRPDALVRRALAVAR